MKNLRIGLDSFIKFIALTVPPPHFLHYERKIISAPVNKKNQTQKDMRHAYVITKLDMESKTKIQQK